MIIAESVNYHEESERKERGRSRDKERKQQVRLEKIVRLQGLIEELTNVLRSEK